MFRTCARKSGDISMPKESRKAMVFADTIYKSAKLHAVAKDIPLYKYINNVIAKDLKIKEPYPSITDNGEDKTKAVIMREAIKGNCVEITSTEPEKVIEVPQGLLSDTEDTVSNNYPADDIPIVGGEL